MINDFDFEFKFKELPAAEEEEDDFPVKGFIYFLILITLSCSLGFHLGVKYEAWVSQTEVETRR